MIGTRMTARIGAIALSAIILSACAPASTVTQTGSTHGTYICLWNCGNVALANHPASDTATLIACIIAVVACVIVIATLGGRSR